MRAFAGESGPGQMNLKLIPSERRGYS